MKENKSILHAKLRTSSTRGRGQCNYMQPLPATLHEEIEDNCCCTWKEMNSIKSYCTWKKIKENKLAAREIKEEAAGAATATSDQRPQFLYRSEERSCRQCATRREASDHCSPLLLARKEEVHN
ncbi:hypothetical protein ACOSQ2_014437 [Xanthoceras sorbifolium]